MESGVYSTAKNIIDRPIYQENYLCLFCSIITISLHVTSHIPNINAMSQNPLVLSDIKYIQINIFCYMDPRHQNIINIQYHFDEEVLKCVSSLVSVQK